MAETNDKLMPGIEGSLPDPPKVKISQPANDHKANRGEGGGASKGMAAAFNSTVSFLSLAGKDWLDALIKQPTDNFQFDSRFDNEFDRVIRLVVAVIFLTGIVVGSVGLIEDKTAALAAIKWALSILIIAFLCAIAYGLFAFLCVVRIRDGAERRKLTVAQILYSILYIFVPWIPILAFLWITFPSRGPGLGFAMILLFYLSLGYMFVNFTKAIRRITCCPWFLVWLSVLLPIFLVMAYFFSRPASFTSGVTGTTETGISQPAPSP